MKKEIQEILEKINPEEDFGILSSDLFLILKSIDDLSTAQLVEKISKDPNVVFRILKTVNSPYYLLRERINSIEHAIIYLGREEVKKIILLASLVDVAEKLSLSRSDSLHFIDFATKVAEVSKSIIEHYDYSTIYHPIDGYMAGLMVCLGKLVLNNYSGIDASKISDFWISIDIQKDIARFGIDFIEISSFLLKKYHLEHIIEGYHHIFEDKTDNFLSRVLKLSLNIVSLHSHQEDVVLVLKKTDVLVYEKYDLKNGIMAPISLVEELIASL